MAVRLAREIKVPLVTLEDGPRHLHRTPQRPRLAPREKVPEVDAPLTHRARGVVTHLEPLEVPLRPDPQAVRIVRVADGRRRTALTFPKRVTADAVRVEIDAHELAMLLEGLEQGEERAARRWSPMPSASAPVATR